MKGKKKVSNKEIQAYINGGTPGWNPNYQPSWSEAKRAVLQRKREERKEKIAKKLKVSRKKQLTFLPFTAPPVGLGGYIC